MDKGLIFQGYEGRHFYAGGYCNQYFIPRRSDVNYNFLGGRPSLFLTLETQSNYQTSSSSSSLLLSFVVVQEI